METVVLDFVLDETNQFETKFESELNLNRDGWYCKLKEIAFQKNWLLINPEDQITILWANGYKSQLRLNKFQVLNSIEDAKAVINDLFKKVKKRSDDLLEDTLGFSDSDEDDKPVAAKKSKTEEKEFPQVFMFPKKKNDDTVTDSEINYEVVPAKVASNDEGKNALAPLEAVNKEEAENALAPLQPSSIATQSAAVNSEDTKAQNPIVPQAAVASLQPSVVQAVNNKEMENALVPSSVSQEESNTYAVAPLQPSAIATQSASVSNEDTKVQNSILPLAVPIQKAEDSNALAALQPSIVPEAKHENAVVPLQPSAVATQNEPMSDDEEEKSDAIVVPHKDANAVEPIKSSTEAAIVTSKNYADMDQNNVPSSAEKYTFAESNKTVTENAIATTIPPAEENQIRQVPLSEVLKKKVPPIPFMFPKKKGENDIWKPKEKIPMIPFMFPNKKEPQNETIKKESEGEEIIELPSDDNQSGNKKYLIVKDIEDAYIYSRELPIDINNFTRNGFHSIDLVTDGTNRIKLYFDTRYVRALKMSKGFAHVFGFEPNKFLFNNELAKRPISIEPYFNHLYIRSPDAFKPIFCNGKKKSMLGSLLIDDAETGYFLHKEFFNPPNIEVKENNITQLKFEMTDPEGDPVMFKDCKGYLILEFKKHKNL